MDKNFLKLILLSLIVILGNSFFTSSARAGNGLTLEATKECNIQYTGDSCVAELKLTNNTGEILAGEAFLHIDYQGVCSNNELRDFDGEGIEAQFSITDNNWLNFSSWEEGTTRVLDFKIDKGETQPKLRIKTVSNLCPGEYTFTITLKGNTENSERYITTPTIIGGSGGGGYYAPPTTPTTNTGKVTATHGEGGVTTLTNPDGSKVELIVPAGAVSRNTHFTIDAVDVGSVTEPNPESGLFLTAGLVYEIKAQRDGEFITTFDKLITLTFTYTEEQIKGLDESSLKIYYWDKTQNQWVALENSEVDVENNTVTASLDHFTLFALMGSVIGFIEEETPKEVGIPEIIKDIPKKIAKGIKKISEGVVPSVPTGESEKPSESEEISLPKETTTPQTKIPQSGLALMLATIGSAWEEIGKSAFLTTVVILCLVVLALIGFRAWTLFQEKKKK